MGALFSVHVKRERQAIWLRRSLNSTGLIRMQNDTVAAIDAELAKLPPRSNPVALYEYLFKVSHRFGDIDQVLKRALRLGLIHSDNKTKLKLFE